MENRRGRHLAGLALAGLAAGAQAECPLAPGERDLDYRVVDERRAVVLLRREPGGARTELCTLALDCTVRGEPANIAYALRPGSIIANDIAALHFLHADGTRQVCGVGAIRAAPGGAAR